MFRARHCCGKLASAGSLDLNPEIAAGKDPSGHGRSAEALCGQARLVRTNTSRFPLRETSFTPSKLRRWAMNDMAKVQARMALRQHTAEIVPAGIDSATGKKCAGSLGGEVLSFGQLCFRDPSGSP